jgi:hypothetical protein
LLPGLTTFHHPPQGPTQALEILRADTGGDLANCERLRWLAPKESAYLLRVAGVVLCGIALDGPFRWFHGRVAACQQPLNGRDSGFGICLHLPKVRQDFFVIRGHNSSFPT